jgi:hypothetical protein
MRNPTTSDLGTRPEKENAIKKILKCAALNKLVRFAHNWNNGILESWNNGFKENRIQSAYYCIDFLVLME